MTLQLPIILPPMGEAKNSQLNRVFADLEAYLNSGVGIPGVTDGSDAAAGDIGEFTSSTIAAGSAIDSNSTSNQFKTITSLSLTAGNWLVCGNVSFAPNSGTGITVCLGAISLYANNTTTDHTTGGNVFYSPPPTSSYDTTVTIPMFRVSVTTTTTVYLKGNVSFGGGQPKQYGSIFAWRPR